LTDIISILDRLGIDVIPNSGAWANGLCPFHEEHRPSFGVNLETGQVNCFADCIHGDIVDLVKMAIGAKNSLEAMKWISGNEKFEIEKNLAKYNEYEEFYPVFTESFIQHLGFELDIENEYLRKRGISSDTIKEWKLYSSIAKICIPIVDKEDDIVGLAYRNLLHENPKYLYSQHCPKSDTLFGINHCSKKSQHPYIILVEGLFDCIWLWQNGYVALAVLGASISQKQFEALSRLTHKVFLCGDNDEAGQKLNKEAYNMFTGANIEAIPITWTGYKDVQEMPPKILKQILKEVK